MKSSDPASLQNLNDIVMPAASGWWPLANGWYFLIGLLLVTLAWFGYRSRKTWLSNRYRRAALQELQLLTEDVIGVENRMTGLRQLPVLLKRTALSAYPRNDVASLSGKNWRQFLNSTAKDPLFTEELFVTLDDLSYTRAELGDSDGRDVSALINASKQWIKHHQVPAPSKHGGER